MKKVEFRQYGPPKDVLTIVDVAALTPAPGEVVIDVEAAPIHLADLKCINGLPWFQVPLPATPGYEGVGRVKSCGPGVENIAVGDRVFLPIRFGSWQEEVVAPAKTLWRAPEGIPAEQLALLPINLQTAYFMLRDMTPLQPGDWLIQNAANSNVGYYIIRLARQMGIKTINVVRREELIPRLLAVGADVCLMDGPDLVPRVREQVGDGKIRLGIDAVAGPATQRLAECLEDNGVVASYGFLTDKPCEMTPQLLMFKNISLVGFFTTRSIALRSESEMKQTHEDINRMMLEERPDAKIAKTYLMTDLHEVREAATHAGRVGSEREGKIVLVR